MNADRFFFTHSRVQRIFPFSLCMPNKCYLVLVRFELSFLFPTNEFYSFSLSLGHLFICGETERRHKHRDKHTEKRITSSSALARCVHSVICVSQKVTERHWCAFVLFFCLLLSSLFFFFSHWLVHVHRRCYTAKSRELNRKQSRI